jgi:hypothetical protein
MLEELRGKVDELQRALQLVALRTMLEQDPGALQQLQEESLRLQEALHTAEVALAVELKATNAGRLDAAPAPSPSGTGQRMGRNTTGLEASVTLRMPNVPTSMVHLLARSGTPLVTVSVINASRETRRIRVTTWIEGFSAHAIGTKEIESKQTESFDQFPAFFPERLEAVTELTTAALHVQVEDIGGELEQHNTYPISLLARTTAVLLTRDPMKGEVVDLTKHLAAWVTPNAPEVLDVLRRAADLSKLKAMLGYQIDADGVREHVRAIFEMLKTLGIVYVNSPISFGNVDGQFIQRVRLPQESIKSRSANCIDGTVLMASLLEATAIDPAIVLVPGHAYLAWRTQRPKAGVEDTWEYLETTMISTASFDDACKAAKERTDLQLARMKLNPSLYVRLLPIPELRREGISPMA